MERNDLDERPTEGADAAGGGSGEAHQAKPPFDPATDDPGSPAYAARHSYLSRVEAERHASDQGAVSPIERFKNLWN